jgi:hypothetical protein
MYSGMVNIRCEGTIQGKGTLFVKKEIRRDGTEVHVVFERKGLGKAKEQFFNLFRQAEAQTKTPEEWVRSLTPAEGYLIKPAGLISNIKAAADTSSISSLQYLTITLYQEGLPMDVQIPIFLEKEGSLPAEEKKYLIKINQLLLDGDDALEQLHHQTRAELVKLRKAVGLLQASGNIAKLSAADQQRIAALDAIEDRLTLLIQAASV